MEKTKVIVFIVIILVISIEVISLATTNIDNRTVFICDDSSKYHLKGCDEMHTIPKKTTVENAEKNGLSPCKECNPYGLALNYSGNSSVNNSFLGWIFLILTYMVIPISLKIHKTEWYSKRNLKDFVIRNSLIGATIILLAMFPNIKLAYIIIAIILGLIFGCINYYLLKDNVEEV